MDKNKFDREDKKSNDIAKGVGLGLLFGNLIGMIIFAITQKIVFLTVCVSFGMFIGIIAASALNKKSEW